MLNKKNLFILFFILLIIIGIFFLKNHIKNNNFSEDLEFYTIHSGYLHITNSDKEIIIKKRSELERYCRDYNNHTYDGQGNVVSETLDDLLYRYDNEYFKDNSLALKYIETSSGGDLIDFEEAIITKSNKLKLDYNVENIGITDDMSGYLLVIEIDKSVNEFF